jgi:CDP-glycerol glycerophosphotransferase
MKFWINFILKYFVSELLNLFVKRKKNYWLFSSSFATKFNYNSKYLFMYVIENNPEIKARFVINDDKFRQALTQKYGDYFVETKSFRGIINALQAGVWIISSGFPILMLMSNYKRVIFNVWHGVPLKSIGLSENSISNFKKVYIKTFHSRNYSYLSVPSSKLIDVFSKSLGLKNEKIKVLGQPRNDMLFKVIDFDNWLRKSNINIPKYQKLIFYAPTFRENKDIKLFPFDDFEFKQLNEWLDINEYVIILRLHQSDKTDISRFLNSERIILLSDKVVDDIMDVLSCFDMLITDYSSIYIDYLLMNKPVLFLPYDYNEYIKNRGLLFDYQEFTPGPKPTSFIEFKNEIDNLLIDQQYYSTERIKINNFFNEIGDGSCNRIVDFIQKENH